jgi:hypothetical protein
LPYIWEAWKDVERRKVAGDRINRVLRPLMKNKKSSMKAKTVLHDMILIPTLMYGSETWAWTKKDEKNVWTQVEY